MKIDSTMLEDYGMITLTPEHDEDIWSVYNLVSINDHVKAITTRKISIVRVPLEVEVKVQKIDYGKDDNTLRLSGKMIRMIDGQQYHTLEITPNTPFMLKKSSWDSIAQDQLERSCDPTTHANLGILLMEEGVANYFFLAGSVTKNVSSIKCSMSRKHGQAISAYDSSIRRFFADVMESCVLRHIDFKLVKRLVIASPGFTNHQFYRYLLNEAERRDLKSILENKSNIVLVHANTGFKHGLKEVLNDPNVMELIEGTQVAIEVKALKDFYDVMRKDDSRICYGSKEVEYANEQAAIESLLITDELFRNSNVNERKKYIDLVESVKRLGGVVNMFSCMHESGKELADLSGIAAVLRFPMPELEELDFI